jgi:hypothetical protein
LEESEQGGKDKKIVDGLDFLNRSWPFIVYTCSTKRATSIASHGSYHIWLPAYIHETLWSFKTSKNESFSNILSVLL